MYQKGIFVEVDRKKTVCVLLAAWILITLILPAVVFAQPETTERQQTEETEERDQDPLSLSSPSVLLMEASTGKVIYEKNAEEKRSPASITKIMTLLLIFDELKKGGLKLEDEIVTSAYAKSMGGSQVFLEEGEKQTAETMIKCIVVASGNDASVAMAEHIAGSEEEFVRRMNEKAEQLGLQNTHFEDCCGLTDSQSHYTSAHDVAVMSRELIVAYQEILSYSSIWMEDITHITPRETKNFTLTNTNKLIRGYEGCVGLKTGSTSTAKYCVSAVAKRNNVMLIAVVMGAPDHKVRFSDAAAMLNYGFGICRVYTDDSRKNLVEIPVKNGTKETVKVGCEEPFRYVFVNGEDLSMVTSREDLPDQVLAPVRKGETAGRIIYEWNGNEIGSSAVVYQETVERAGFLDSLQKAGQRFLLHAA